VGAVAQNIAANAVEAVTQAREVLLVKQSVHAVVGIIGDALVDLAPADQRRALKSVFIALGLGDPTQDLIGAYVRVVRRGNPNEITARGIVRHVQEQAGSSLLLISSLHESSFGVSGCLFQISIWDESSEVIVEEPQPGENHVG
jgi:hypothetical protein